MPAKITLNKFELMWLFEGAAGKSHLRWDVYPLFADTIYRQLGDDEKEFLYAYIKRDTSWLWENKEHLDKTPHNYWLQVLARYNPANQYIVTMKDEKGKEIVADDTYLWEGKYHTGWNRYCSPEHIIDVKQKPFKRCVNSLCFSKQLCKRFVEREESENLIDGCKTFYEFYDKGIWHCPKCDMIIEQE